MAVAVSTFVGTATDPVAVTAGIRSAIVAAGPQDPGPPGGLISA